MNGGGPDLRNESAASFSWLCRSLGLSFGSSSSKLVDAWSDVRDRMRRSPRGPVYMADWPSDPWLALGVESTEVFHVVGAWRPPDRIDEWPHFDIDDLVRAGDIANRTTRHQAFVELLVSTGEVHASDRPEALSTLLEGKAAIRSYGDAPMVQRNQVFSWLFAALGDLLAAVTLSPTTDPDLLTAETRARLKIPLTFVFPREWAAANEFESKRLDLLYNLRMAPTGELVEPNDLNIRIGQSEAWRQPWVWLSADSVAHEASDAVQIAARLMRCEPLLQAVLIALQDDDARLQVMAVAVLRRWLLTLKAMTWLEDALQADWADVRPKDLACFAFNALKPAWPRRILAISHRSGDVKPSLIKTTLWRSSRCAIDATYVPTWETNTGMVWGLFASTPAIARVESPGYVTSVWCRREMEMTQHLLERGDFLSERRVIDLDVSSLAALERLTKQLEVVGAELSRESAAIGFYEFPPLIETLMPTPMPIWEVQIWRAASALRTLNVWLRNSEVTNRLAAALLAGDSLGVPPPTNNPGGWRDYAAVFRDVQSIADIESSELTISLPPDYGEEETQRDITLLQRMLDLSTGSPALADVLVALEWLRTEWPDVVAEKPAIPLTIDCRGLSRDLWAQGAELSLQRGLLGVRLPVPVWIVQSAGQGVEGWDLPQDVPIFTEHLRGQFSWMFGISLDRAEALMRFPEDSGLTLSPELAARCERGR